jgi:hypothetical protein
MGLVALANFGPVAAQAETEGATSWFGVSGTYHLLYGGVQARVGAYDLLADGLDARLELSYLAYVATVCPAVPDTDCRPPLAFEIAPAALWRFSAGQGLGGYLGAGPRLAVYFLRDRYLDIFFGASGFVGADYRFGDTSLVLEAGATLFYDPLPFIGFFYLPHLSLGVNLYF